MADRRKTLEGAVLLAFVLLGVYLTYLVLRSFVAALTWGIIFAIFFRDMHVRLAARMGPNRAATVTTLFVAFVIVAPAVVLISTLQRETPQITDYLKQTSQAAPAQLQRIWDAVRARSPVALPEDARALATEGGRRIVTFLAPHAGAFVADALAMLGTLASMLFALFFMLRDGDKWSVQLRDRLPFSNNQNEEFISGIRELVFDSVGAGLVVAAVQGLIGGLTFWLLGIDAPVFWGMAMGFASMLPVVGASVVWFPAAVGLLLAGDIWRGVIVLVVGTFGINVAGNVLRPMLLSGKTAISGLVILFGSLGGAAAFGFVGLVIGPIILVTTARIFDYLRQPELPDASAQPRDRAAAAITYPSARP